jgi:hypothetical protein
MFCALKGIGLVLPRGYPPALCIADAYPVREGHRLVNSWRQVVNSTAPYQAE